MMPVMRNQNWLPSLFNDFFGDEWMGMQHKHASVPAINIIENEKDFRVELAVPGTTKEDFKVNVNADNELVISLEKRSEKEEKEGDKDKKEGHRGTYLRREFSYTSFQQSFSLPDDVDRQKISAKVENGVLTINLPKKRSLRPRRFRTRSKSNNVRPKFHGRNIFENLRDPKNGSRRFFCPADNRQFPHIRIAFLHCIPMK